MNFNELKNLARKLGGILVMNGNQPEFVVLTFKDFERLQSLKGPETGNPEDRENEDESTAIERLNKEISALKEEIRQKEEAELEEEEEGVPDQDEIGVKPEDLTS